MDKHKSKTGKAGKRAAGTDTGPEKASAPAPEMPHNGSATKPRDDDGQAERLLRLQADFDNFRKRVQRERGDWYQQANEDLILQLLPILDHFELGLHTAEKHQVDPAVIDGFRMVYDQLEQTLAKFQLSPIDAEGRDFDPHQHEAITHVPSEEHPADTVVAQTRRGYKLGDKLIRPAQVVVSSGPSSEDGAGAETTPDAPDSTDRKAES